MKLRLSLFALLSLALTTLLAQPYANLTFSPAQPKPGDVIKIEYSPSGSVLGDVKDFEAIAYIEDGVVRAQELSLTQQGDKWIAEIHTNDTTKAVLVVFKKDQNFDNNKEQGYSLMMMKDGRPVKGAYASLANVNNFGGFLAQMKVPAQTNLDLYGKEMALDPSLKSKYLSTAAGLMMKIDKEKAPAKVNAMIAEILKNKKLNESDYQAIMAAYGQIKDKTNADKIKATILKKYPHGLIAKGEMITAFYNEADLKKKEESLDKLMKAFPAITDADKKNLENYYSALAAAAATAKDWDKMDFYVSKITNKENVANTYNEAAWAISGEGLDGETGDLAKAKELSARSLDYMKESLTSMPGKPTYMTPKQYAENINFSYGNFMDTYALILWKLNDAAKALEFQEKAIDIMKRNNSEANERYIVYKEKASGPNAVMTEVEGFVKDGKSTPKMKEILKKAYMSQQHTEDEYTVYMDGLMKAWREKMRDEMLKKMINQAAPTFALRDISGNNVSLDDLKGKVVVVDFWATWCGPCRASFPGMQMAVEKYKDDPAVKFVFVDSWENKKPEENLKNADEFVKKNKYSFHVLLDNDDKVIGSYEVGGIPTKFVIDPNSRIRFKAVGFSGSSDQLLEEMTVMIDALKSGTGADGKKAF